jgi:hypothetical protein
MRVGDGEMVFKGGEVHLPKEIRRNLQLLSWRGLLVHKHQRDYLQWDTRASDECGRGVRLWDDRTVYMLRPQR